MDAKKRAVYCQAIHRAFSLHFNWPSPVPNRYTFCRRFQRKSNNCFRPAFTALLLNGHSTTTALLLRTTSFQHCTRTANAFTPFLASIVLHLHQPRTTVTTTKLEQPEHSDQSNTSTIDTATCIFKSIGKTSFVAALFLSFEAPSFNSRIVLIHVRRIHECLKHV